MCERIDPRDESTEELRALMPPVPSEAALGRARERMRERIGTHKQVRAGLRWPLMRPAWGVGFVSIAVVAAMVAGALVLAPRFETRAFARERAAIALGLPTDGRVLHIVARLTGTGWTEQYGQQPTEVTMWDEWADPAAMRNRMEYRNESGVLDEITVRVGDRELWTAGLSGDKPQLFESDLTGKPYYSALGGMTGAAREALLDGRAKATGTEMIDGEKYWVVTYSTKDGNGGTSSCTVKMRVSDYRVKSWTCDDKFHNGNGDTTGHSEMEYLSYELMDPSDVPTSTFSFDNVLKRVPEGTKIEKRDLPM